jgi:uncharacterized Ntn-hydrolase superfamily protein
MTFSIAARCARSGMFAVAVSSSSPAVAARCAYARARIGALSTQNVTDPRLGPRGLDLMSLGASAPEAIEIIRGTAPDIEFRQLVAVDAQGRGATFSGSGTLGRHASATAADVAAAGNLLATTDVPSAMVAAFAEAGGHLGDRVLRAMRAALEAGGEEGPVHSAGMLVVDATPWPLADLRVDWADDDPIAGLERLWQLWKPQMDAYVTRALNPSGAPSFGVPGDH